MRSFWKSAAIAAVASLSAVPAMAQQYPAKAIRFIVGFAPGGPNDMLARMVGTKMAESFGVPVTVDNRPGADSIIGTEIAVKSPADGYTIVMVSAASTIHPNLYSNLPYQLQKDLQPITVMASSNYVVVCNARLPVKNIKELIALAKSRPGQLNFAGSGVGDAIHLAGELFKSMAGVDMHLIAYRGGGPAMMEVVGGQVELMFSPMGVAAPHLQTGRIRALGVTGPRRWPTLPNVPTVSESGVPGYEVTGWYGVLAPAGTPRPAVDRLNGEISKIVRSPELAEKMAAMGVEPIGNTPEQMAAHLATELVKWQKVAKAANLKAQAMH